MSLINLGIEIELQDTFQNGKKLDQTRLFNALHAAASQDYEKQVEENRVEFKMRMTTPSAAGRKTLLEGNILELTERAE